MLQFTPMTKFSQIVKMLSKERDVVEQQLSRLNAALNAFADVYKSPRSIQKRRRRSKMSAAGRARISAAQKARWAKLRARK